MEVWYLSDIKVDRKGGGDGKTGAKRGIEREGERGMIKREGEVESEREGRE